MPGSTENSRKGFYNATDKLHPVAPVSFGERGLKSPRGPTRSRTIAYGAVLADRACEQP